jgi:4-amino-4-deoxy-L-arabinose transferase-like glycosyltransferase
MQRNVSYKQVPSYQQGDYVLCAGRPPGYPFFLAASMAILGKPYWLPAFTNLLLYVGTSAVAFSVAKKLSGCKAALVSVALLAVWPSSIFMTGLAFTEPLSAFFFTASFWALIELERGGWPYAVFAGVLTGLGALVRPSFLLLPILWLCFLLMKRHRRWSSIQLTAVAATSMVLVIVRGRCGIIQSSARL